MLSILTAGAFWQLSLRLTCETVSLSSYLSAVVSPFVILTAPFHLRFTTLQRYLHYCSRRTHYERPRHHCVRLDAQLSLPAGWTRTFDAPSDMASLSSAPTDMAPLSVLSFRLIRAATYMARRECRYQLLCPRRLGISKPTSAANLLSWDPAKPCPRR